MRGPCSGESVKQGIHHKVLLTLMNNLWKHLMVSNSSVTKFISCLTKSILAVVRRVRYRIEVG